jgi:NAD kinase
VQRQTDNKIVLVCRRTRLEELIARYNTLEQVKFYLKGLGQDIGDYLEEDKRYQQALAEAETVLVELGRLQLVQREYLPNFLFGKQDVVVAIGQDGLVANVLKYLDEQPLIGVNPDKLRWDGVLLPFVVGDLRQIILDVFAVRRSIKKVSMAQASLNNGQILYAVNDLFIGRDSHVSARYHIEQAGFAESQSSSGIIISTGLGSTGWLKSVIAGAAGICQALLGEGMQAPVQPQMPWDAQWLIYSVREPFPSRSSQTSMVFGTINKGRPLRLVSQMPQGGVIFSDGIEEDYLTFSCGLEASVQVADKVGHLVV